MAKQTYIKNDLIDYVDGAIESPHPDQFYSGSRVDWLVHNLPPGAAVQCWRSGGYQGKLAFVIRLDDYVWLFNDYYGSCSGCDAFMNDARGYAEDMFRDAYCFPTEAHAMEYINSTEDFSWEDTRPHVKDMLEDPCLYLKNPKTEFRITDQGDEREMHIIHQERRDERK